MNTWWVRGDPDDLPPIDEIIEEARRQRAGPPQDSRAMAYQPVLVLARGMLSQEIKDKKRRAPVLKEFDERVAKIEKQLKACKTFGDQLRIRFQIIDIANYFGLDLRGQRSKKGPSDEILLEEYELIRPRVSAIFRRTRDFREAVRQVSEEFPFLTAEQASEAVHDKPSWGAYTVLGALHGLSPSSVRDRLTAARRGPKKTGR